MTKGYDKDKEVHWADTVIKLHRGNGKVREYLASNLEGTQVFTNCTPFLTAVVD